ncbi:hypothetical protein, conserved [Trypanosoma brucei gambiense DAL972]|uniref:Uncharacterized protein n=1 Tax=Trypanosoma brucei gambiense (strain MHOM/CI/86/DAL972) TaxID=679716 RepID=C9ZWJ7_TRYB9|nr:hypothetical protein, conserved [Trypanosoma brucei gambiense DAL972]CBH13786.1 hypothetical protein, conserved [Trypanosoma brucei gambiense DAL972]|eukprot:XP_011776062.1 hypothetical protein, conserved [Trypanosoma brucei gambiense DAL972]
MWEAACLDGSLNGVQQETLRFEEDSGLHERDSPTIWSKNSLRYHDTTQPYVRDGEEKQRQHTNVHSIVLSDLDNSGGDAPQMQLNEHSVNTSRVLFTSRADFTSFCSVEEKNPENAEVATRRALTIHNNARQILQAYRALKFTIEQQVYRRYFLKWLQIHWSRGPVGGPIQTSAALLLCSTPQVVKRQLEDGMEGLLWDTASKSTPLSVPSSIKYGLSSTGHSGSNRRQELQSDGQPYESTPRNSPWSATKEPSCKLAYGEKHNTPSTSATPSNKDSSLYSCNVSSIHPDRGTPQREEFPCLRLPALGTPRSQSVN